MRNVSSSSERLAVPYDLSMSNPTTSELDELQALRQRTRELEAELDALRRAHDAQARRLVAERLALADEVEREVETLREEIEWRKEVMEHLEPLRDSRSVRYTAPLRRLAAFLRRR
jgi:uncharacterized coiled-coil DUF342 family protein